MSGHSHYSTIKRQKEAKDAKRGNMFSKLSRAITIAVKSGGGPDPDSNYKLRFEIDKARAINMPKDNIQRAIDNASTEGESLEEINYEGFGPFGMQVVVVVSTDNRNRTAQEIKNLFERGGGSLGGPNSVLFNFENKGLMVIKKTSDPENQMLSLIDAGVEDISDTDDGIEVYVAPEKLVSTKEDLEKAGFEVLSAELYMKPKTLLEISDENKKQKAISFLESFEDHDDVVKVYSNIDLV